MRTIEMFEKVTGSGKSLEELGINSTMYWAYRNSKEAGCDTLNFDDVIWEKDIEAIVTACKEYGIERITISSSFSGLLETLAKFEELGGKVDGLTKVTSKYTDFVTREKRVEPAVVVKF